MAMENINAVDRHRSSMDKIHQSARKHRSLSKRIKKLRFKNMQKLILEKSPDINPKKIKSETTELKAK